MWMHCTSLTGYFQEKKISVKVTFWGWAIELFWYLSKSKNEVKGIWIKQYLRFLFIFSSLCICAIFSVCDSLQFNHCFYCIRRLTWHSYHPTSCSAVDKISLPTFSFRHHHHLTKSVAKKLQSIMDPTSPRLILIWSILVPFDLLEWQVSAKLSPCLTACLL